MINMKSTKAATRVSVMKRQLEGEKQRRQLLFYIEDHPGLSGYKLSQRLQWSRGKTAYHLKKLINQGEVKTELVSSNPHPKKVYFAVGWEEMIDWDKIPEDKHPPKREPAEL